MKADVSRMGDIVDMLRTHIDGVSNVLGLAVGEFKFNVDEYYYSHTSLLAAAVIGTTGPVLELGAGFGSSLMLHGMCAGQKRNLVTLESNESWLNRFSKLSRNWHNVRFVDDFLNLPEYSSSWGLVFVDHGISEQRGISIEALKSAHIIIAHDSCHPHLYNYDVLDDFKYRFDQKIDGLPQTTAVSNFVNVTEMFAELQL